MEWMFLPLKRYADFEGRSRRMEYWMFWLFQFVVYFIFAILFIVFAGVTAAVTDGPGSGSETAMGFVGLFLIGLIGLFWLAMLVPSIAVSVRRFHDQDQSGWLYLINFIPLGGLVVFVFMLLEGTRGPNQYGDDPKGPGVDPSTFA